MSMDGKIRWVISTRFSSRNLLLSQGDIVSAIKANAFNLTYPTRTDAILPVLYSPPRIPVNSTGFLWIPVDQSLSVHRNPSQSTGIPLSPQESLSVHRNPPQSTGIPLSPQESTSV